MSIHLLTHLYIVINDNAESMNTRAPVLCPTFPGHSTTVGMVEPVV
jgi:hypothetical protein